jgi:hypothetical protein
MGETNSPSVAHVGYDISPLSRFKGLGAIRDKIGPTSDIDNIFSKMYSQYVLFIINTVS